MRVKGKVALVISGHILAAILYNTMIHWLWSPDFMKNSSEMGAQEALSFLAPQNTIQPQDQADLALANSSTLQVIEKTPHGNESFSACLLVMDENFRLQEWLAYSYYTLRLRYVVVTVDPRSKQLPTPVLDLFRDELNMTILEWNDTNFATWKKPFPDTAPRNMVRKRHRARQNLFYQACMKHLYDRGHTWTVLYDTDEFLVFDKYNHTYEGGKFTSPPSMAAKPGVILDFLHQAQASHSNNTFLNTMCYMIPRLLHGGKEITEEELLASVPNGSTVVPSQLDTLRWRYHNQASNAKANGLAKVIIDVSRLKPFFPLVVQSPHRPIMDACGPSSVYKFIKDSPFRINHYLGSWEAYSYREDSRKGAERSRQTWELRSKKSNTVRTDRACMWLKGFYDEVGVETANIVLAGAGIPKSYRRENYTDWNFRGEKSLTHYQVMVDREARANGIHAKTGQKTKSARRKDGKKKTAKKIDDKSRLHRLKKHIAGV